ncbi:MAG: DUF4082 domain-containing protein [Cytophagales bacterium]|nr:DUF4082 domain-containing protein [Cytophagales bacterium]
MKCKLILLVAAGVALLTACNKEKAPPEEQALGAFLADSTTRVVKGLYSNIEIGYRFYASRPGRIIKIGTKLPQAGTYTVSLWDSDTQMLLEQKTVGQTGADMLTLQSIPPLTVLPNKKYVVSVYYDSSPKPVHVIVSRGPTAMLPFTKGSLTVVNAQFRNSQVSTFPVLADNVGIYGYPEVVFVAD